MRRFTAFVVAAGILLLLALNDGGYDIVTRQQMGAALWTVLALGFAFGVLPRGRPSRWAMLALGSLIALALFSMLALVWTESDERTLEEVARVLQYTGLVALAFSGLNRHTWRAAAAGLAAAALLLPILSLVSRLAPETITDQALRVFQTDRLSYPFGYWNAVGAWGAMAIAIALVWSAHARATVTRALALATVPASALSVYLSYSRSGVIAVGIAVVAAVAFSRHRWTASAHALVAAAGSAAAVAVVRDQPEIARATGDAGAGKVVSVLLLAALACLVAAFATRALRLDCVRLPSQTARVVVPVAIALVVIVGFAAGHRQLSESWHEFRDERTSTGGNDQANRLQSFGGNRYDVWSAAFDAFEGDPGKGTGPGTFEFFWSRDSGHAQYLRDAHSLYFEQLAELGLIGLAAVLVAIGALLTAAITAQRGMRRSANAGAAGAAIAAFVVFLFSAGVDWMWELPAVGGLALGGIAVAAAGSFPRRSREPIGTRAGVAIVAGAVIAVAIQAPGLIATERDRASATALNDGDARRAGTLADEAIRAEPWAASPYVQRALAEQQLGDLSAARADLGDAIDREPTNWRHHFLLARLEAQAGRRAAVKQELAEVRRLAPGSIFLLPGARERGQIDAVLSGSGRGSGRGSGSGSG